MRRKKQWQIQERHVNNSVLFRTTVNYGHSDIVYNDSTSSHTAQNLVTGPPNVSCGAGAELTILRKVLKVKKCWKQKGPIIYLLQMLGGQHHCLESVRVATMPAKGGNNLVSIVLSPFPIECTWFHSPLVNLYLFLSIKFYPGRYS